MKILVILRIILLVWFPTLLFGQNIDSNSNIETNQIFHSSAYYNLGIMYLQENDIGRAILNLKRAHLLNPYDSDIEEALTAARESIGIPAYFFEATPIEKAVLLPFRIFTINAMVLIGLVLFIVGNLALSFRISRLPPPPLYEFLNRVWVRILSIVFIILGLIYYTAAVIRYRNVMNPDQAVVLHDHSILEKPLTNALQLDKVEAGIECRIQKKSGGFYLISTIDGKEGWIITNNVGRVWEESIY